MKNRKKIVRIKDRKNNIPKPPICPYCGRRSVLRPAEYVYGDNTISAGSFLYAVSYTHLRYPGNGDGFHWETRMGYHPGSQATDGFVVLRSGI